MKRGVTARSGVFRVTFLEPERKSRAKEAMDDEVGHFVSEGAAFPFARRVTLNEELAPCADPASPRVERRLSLEGCPIFGFFEDKDVAFSLPLRRVLIEFPGNYPVVIFRLHRHGRGDEAL